MLHLFANALRCCPKEFFVLVEILSQHLQEFSEQREIDLLVNGDYVIL